MQPTPSPSKQYSSPLLEVTGVMGTAAYHSYYNPNQWKIAIAIGLTISGLLFTSFANSSTLKVNRLCVLYDAGETTALIPVLKKWEKEGVDFHILVMATAETLIKPDMFTSKRLVLKDIGVMDTINQQTERTTGLGQDALKQLNKIKPKMVLVGTASRVQQQFLEKFSNAETVAFVDNFDYDPENASYATVMKVQAAAKHVLCPSQNMIEILKKENRSSERSFHVVGKPTLEIWEKEIASVDRAKVLDTLQLKENGGAIITLIGGYGSGYDTINPLFSQYTEQLKKEGFQVILQPHPKVSPQKVKTTEALAVSDYVIGYNSSVILDAALIGKNALFLLPENLSFKHFAITKGLISQVSDFESLTRYIREGKTPAENIRKTLNVPQNSTEIICTLLDTL